MIDAFLRGLESIFAWLIEASWQASVLVALVLLLHLILRGRLNPRWHHALWLLVIARLLLPFLPESAFSVFQFAPSPPPVVTETVTEPIFNALPMPMAGTPQLPAPPEAYPFSAFTVLALVWLAGALALLILTWQVNRRFARHVVAAPLVINPRLLKLAETAQQELGLHRRLRIIESAEVQSPAIMGLFRPTLILPKDVRARFEDDELRFIFLHEFAHLKRGDLFLQWLVALLQILHWFNPVLWYAFRRMRADREPATDALVLSCTGEAYKESYGQVLVKLLEHYHQRHSLPTLVGILEDKDQFKRRFSLIAKFTRGAYGWSLLGMVILGVLAVVGLTKKLDAATTDNDPLIDISSSKLEFKIDPKETKQVEEFQAVLRSPTEKGLNQALQKTHGFLLLGTGHDIQFHLSALTPPKDPNEHKIFRSSTQLHLGEDTVDSKINLHWIDAERVRINCLLELRDAKNVSLGLLSATWIQPIGKDGVLLLAKNGLTILAPQSDGSQIGCILRFVARANPKVGISVLAASDQMSDVELLPSGSDDAGHVVTTDDETAFYQALERDRTMVADSSVKSSTLAADAQMLLAIQKGDVAALKKVLEHAVEPNTFDPDRFHSCPVYWAVQFNQPEILKLLLEHFATGDLGPAQETPLQLAQRIHPDLVPIIEEGIRRNRVLLTARLTEKLHSIHIDLPAFSGAPLSQVTKFLLDDTASKAGYLDRRIDVGTMDLPPSTKITSPARPNIPIWDALQTIADANKLRFDVDGSWPGNITLYPPRDEAIIHPAAEKTEDPPSAPAKAGASTQVTDANTQALDSASNSGDSTAQPDPDEWTIHNLKVSNMPLTELAHKLTVMTKADDPKGVGVAIDIKVPPGEKPLKITYGYPPYTGDLGNLLYHLADLYPIRYELQIASRSTDSQQAPITLTQLPAAEAQLNKKAGQTKIDLDFNGADFMTALDAVQQEAATKGFRFEINVDALKGLSLPPVSIKARSWSVEHAILSLCYLADLVARPLESFTGYEFRPGSVAELHDRTCIRFGIATAFYKADDKSADSNLAANLAGKRTWGPSEIMAAYPWVYHGKEMAPMGGTIGTQFSYHHKVGDPAGFVVPVEGAPSLETSFKTFVADKTHIRMTITLRLKKPDGSVLRELTGETTAPSGAILKLVIHGAPLQLDTPKDPTTKSNLYVFAQADYVDDGKRERDIEPQQLELVSRADIIQQVEMSDTSATESVPAQKSPDATNAIENLALTQALVAAVNQDDPAEVERLLKQGAKAGENDVLAVAAAKNQKLIQLLRQYNALPISDLAWAVLENRPMNEILQIEEKEAKGLPFGKLGFIQMPSFQHGALIFARQLPFNEIGDLSLLDDPTLPLPVAALMGDLPTVELLIQIGVNPNALPWRNPANPWLSVSPLSLAALAGHDDVIGYLLQHGAKAHSNDIACVMQGWPSAFSTQETRENSVNLLIAAGALKNITEEQTASLFASSFQNPEGNLGIVKLLLNTGLSPKARTSDFRFEGKTVIELTRKQVELETKYNPGWERNYHFQRNTRPLLELLEKAQATPNTKPPDGSSSVKNSALNKSPVATDKGSMPETTETAPVVENSAVAQPQLPMASKAV